jgi:hypothetical protein
MHTKFWLGNLKGRDHLEDLVIDMGGECGLVTPSPGEGSVVGSCEYSNEPSGSKKGGEFFD